MDQVLDVSPSAPEPHDEARHCLHVGAVERFEIIDLSLGRGGGTSVELVGQRRAASTHPSMSVSSALGPFNGRNPTWAADSCGLGRGSSRCRTAAGPGLEPVPDRGWARARRVSRFADGRALVDRRERTRPPALEPSELAKSATEVQDPGDAGIDATELWSDAGSSWVAAVLHGSERAPHPEGLLTHHADDPIMIGTRSVPILRHERQRAQ